MVVCVNKILMINAMMTMLKMPMIKMTMMKMTMKMRMTMKMTMMVMMKLTMTTRWEQVTKQDLTDGHTHPVNKEPTTDYMPQVINFF